MLFLKRKLVLTRKNTALDREKFLIFKEIDALVEKHLEEDLENLKLDTSEKATIIGKLNKLYPADIADFINHLPTHFKEFFINQIVTEIKPKFLLELSPEFLSDILANFSAKTLKFIFSELDVGDDVYLLKILSKEDQTKILAALPKTIGEPLFRILSYPKDSIGRVMQLDFISVTKNWKVGEVVNYIKNAKYSSTYYHIIIVVDSNNQPLASIPLSKLIRSKSSYFVEDIMEPIRKIFTTLTDKEEVAFYFQKYGLVAAPVVNESGQLIGVVNINDIVEVIGEEGEEDVLRLAGVGQSDINASAITTAKHRFPWLFVNLITAIMAAGIVYLFSGTIDKLVSIAVLMPITASMSGNAGMQALAVAVRALATKELSKTNTAKVIFKELISGFLNGIVFCILVFTVTYLVYANLMLSVIFSVAMFSCLCLAGLFGILTPVVLAKLGRDPAVSSSIFLTTFTDISSFSIFLGMAYIFLL